MSTIPTCAVTGAIPGDGGACGDCDPCIVGEAAVPEAVKRLIAEKNSLLNRVGELESSDYDSMKAGEMVSEMWLNLAKTFRDGVSSAFVAGDNAAAIKMACCAEACFWKATGDSDTHDVKDVLGFAPSSHTEDVSN